MNDNTNTTLLPADGKTTKNNDTLWDPNSNICDVAINLNELYNVDISYKDKGETITNRSRVKCFQKKILRYKNGEKVSKYSPAQIVVEEIVILKVNKIIK